MDMRARTWCSISTWRDPCAAVSSRGERPLLANGHRMNTSWSNNMSLKNKCVTSATSSQLLEKFEYQYKLRRRYESEEDEYEHRTGRTLGDARLYATTGIARSSGTVGILA